MSKAIELADKTPDVCRQLRTSGIPISAFIPHIQKMADELRRLAGVEKRLEAADAELALVTEMNEQLREQNTAVDIACAKYEAELAAIRALEPVGWAYVDMWRGQEDPVDDCFFIYNRKGTTPLYALPEQK